MNAQIQPVPGTNPPDWCVSLEPEDQGDALILEELGRRFKIVAMQREFEGPVTAVLIPLQRRPLPDDHARGA